MRTCMFFASFSWFPKILINFKRFLSGDTGSYNERIKPPVELTALSQKQPWLSYTQKKSIVAQEYPSLFSIQL